MALPVELVHPLEALPVTKIGFPVNFRSNFALPVKILRATGALRGAVLKVNDIEYGYISKTAPLICIPG